MPWVAFVGISAVFSQLYDRIIVVLRIILSSMTMQTFLMLVGTGWIAAGTCKHAVFSLVQRTSFIVESEDAGLLCCMQPFHPLGKIKARFSLPTFQAYITPKALKTAGAIGYSSHNIIYEIKRLQGSDFVKTAPATHGSYQGHQHDTYNKYDSQQYLLYIKFAGKIPGDVVLTSFK